MSPRVDNRFELAYSTTRWNVKRRARYRPVSLPSTKRPAYYGFISVRLGPGKSRLFAKTRAVVNRLLVISDCVVDRFRTLLQYARTCSATIINAFVCVFSRCVYWKNIIRRPAAARLTFDPQTFHVRIVRRAHV